MRCTRSISILILAGAFATLTWPEPASARPLLRNACKLVTNAEIERLMGHRPVERHGYPEGCVWITWIPRGGGKTGERSEQAAVSLTGFRNVREAREYADAYTSSVGCDWDPLLPTRALGDDAWLEDCGDVFFRLGRVTGDVTTHTNAVREGSPADERRTLGLARKAIKRLRRYRCGPPLCPRR